MMKIGGLMTVCVLAMAVAMGLVGTQASLAASPEWDKLVADAKAEGKVEVVLSGQMPVKLRGVMGEFEKKYGIKTNFQIGQGRAHAARILAERKAGKFTVDVWIGGANTALAMLYPAKALAPLDPLLIDPDVRDGKKWYKGRLHYTDPEGKHILAWGASPAHVFVYNTNLVKPDDIKSYWDILDPKWKGKIVGRSPAETGSAATSVPMLLHDKIGEKWFDKLVTEMDLTFVRDSRQGAEWVALGRYAIGLFGLNTPGGDLEKQGFPLKAYPLQILKEGEILTSSAANIMVIDRGPSPKASQLFVNWFLSKEGQTIIAEASETSDSIRIDVPDDLVSEEFRIRADRDYFMPFSESKTYIESQRDLIKTLRGIMKKAGK